MERVRQYFVEHNIEHIIESLVMDLGKQRPTDVYGFIGEWGVKKQQLENSAVAAEKSSSTPAPPIGKSSSGAFINSLSISAGPRQWNVLLLGSDADRNYFFESLIDVDMDMAPAVEDHSRKLRELLRPCYSGKFAIRIVAHQMPNGSDTVVFYDPFVASTTTEKSVFAFGFADVVVVCLKDGSSLMNSIREYRLAADPLSSYLRLIDRMGCRNLVFWCPDAIDVGGLRQFAAECRKEENYVLSSSSALDDSPTGSEAAPLSVSTHAIPHPPSKKLLIETIATSAVSADTYRFNRYTSNVVFEGGTAVVPAPQNGAIIATAIEVRIPFLGVESSARLTVGARLFAHCQGHRFMVAVDSIDLVFEAHKTNKVLRKAVDSAGGDPQQREGAMVSLTLYEKDTEPTALAAVGQPAITLLQVDSVTSAVVQTWHGTMLAVSGDSEESSSDEDFDLS